MSKQRYAQLADNSSAHLDPVTGKIWIGSRQMHAVSHYQFSTQTARIPFFQ